MKFRLRVFSVYQPRSDVRRAVCDRREPGSSTPCAESSFWIVGR